MKKHKIMVSIGTGILGLLAISIVLFALWWSGPLDKWIVKDVATFESPSGAYSLLFQQVGDPAWPFGQTEVRFTPKDQEQCTLHRLDAALHDDGGNAHKGNIKSIAWHDDYLLIVLQASEMADQEIVIPY